MLTILTSCNPLDEGLSNRYSVKSFGIFWNILNYSYCEREVPCLVVRTPYNTFMAYPKLKKVFFKFLCIVIITHSDSLPTELQR